MTRSDVKATLLDKLRASFERERSVSPPDEVPSDRRVHDIQQSIRDWLGVELGSLHKVWLILGAAPNPVIPNSLPSDYILVCVNNAGLTAQRLGLKIPDVTIRTEAKSWTEIEGLQSRTLLWFVSRDLRKMRNSRPASWRHKIGSLRTLKTVDRDDYVARELGDSFVKTEEFDARPSTGIFSCLLALNCDPEKVIVSGFSLRQMGHSYNDLHLARKHIAADLEALKTLSNRHQIFFTAEKELAKDAGMRLNRD